MSETHTRNVTRRTVLGLLLGAGGLLALRFIPDALRRRLEIGSAHAASPDLLERNTWPEHWETTVDALGRSAVTPNDRFFVRSHLPVPELDAATHHIEVAGLVSRPQALDLAALRAMPRTDVLATLECAGNGRGLMPLHNTSGTQWALGAVGTANWSGVALREVLSRAEVSREEVVLGLRRRAPGFGLEALSDPRVEPGVVRDGQGPLGGPQQAVEQAGHGDAADDRRQQGPHDRGFPSSWRP